MEPATIRQTEVTSLMQVPFVDLRFTTEVVRDAVLRDLAELMDAGQFVNGRADRLRARVRHRADSRSASASRAASGWTIRLALSALGVGPGDEVVVPAMTFVATFEAVAQVGATPVPADVRDDDYGLAPNAAAAAVTERTKAVVPVHLYGQMADVTSPAEIARRHDLRLVEDAAQAHGASRDGLRAGTCDAAGAFSFYPSKNLGAMGDAGALITGDGELAERVRALREHGQTGKYRSEYVGYTSRWTRSRPSCSRTSFPLLERWNEQRRQAAHAYGEALQGSATYGRPRP